MGITNTTETEWESVLWQRCASARRNLSSEGSRDSSAFSTMSKLLMCFILADGLIN